MRAAVDVEDLMRVVALPVGRAGVLAAIRRVETLACVVMKIGPIVVVERIVVNFDGVRPMRSVDLVGVRRRVRHDAEVRQSEDQNS
jgi:hypothetical protein